MIFYFLRKYHSYDVFRASDRASCTIALMILVFGSVNVDLVMPVLSLPRSGETVLTKQYSAVPGGKGANQALAARRAGADTIFAGMVGDDLYADLALSLLQEEGVDLRPVQGGRRSEAAFWPGLGELR